MHVYRMIKESDEFRNVRILYTVGYYEPFNEKGADIPGHRWVPLEDTSNEDEARQLVNYLNGGNGTPFNWRSR